MEFTMKKLALAITCALLLPSPAARAQTIADFYRGKQIRIIVGTAPGDYDTWMRMIARHMHNTSRAIRISLSKTCRARVR